MIFTIERDIKIQDTIYSRHTIEAMTYDYITGLGSLLVYSVTPEEDHDIRTYFQFTPVSTSNVETLEDILKGLPEFQEYVDPNKQLVSELSDILTDVQAISFPTAFPLWHCDTNYISGQRVRYNSVLYKCLSDHTSQEDWNPEGAPSLWAKMLIDPEDPDIPEWVQPDSTNPYMTGDKVIFNGTTYESVIDNNVWSPADYPAGWEVV